MTGGGMNLCLACRDVGPDTAGGLARAMRDLAEALAREGNEVHLLTNRSVAPPVDLPDVDVTPVFAAAGPGPFAHAAPDTAAQNLMHAAAVYREVARIHEHVRPVDAVLAPLWRSEGAVCALDDRFPTIVSCMTSIQTLTEVDPDCRRVPDIDERLALEREALRGTRYLHGLTEAALAKTISDYRLEPDAAVVIGRGLRDRGHNGRPEPAHDGPVRVLFVGRLESRKGVDTLLAAARELVDDRVNVTVTLAGPNVNPSYRESLERDAARHSGLRTAVRFTGELSDAALGDLYVQSDIVCVPSRYESHGIVLLEAMMFGKPIVTCDAGGIREVVEPGRNALLVAPEDAHALAGGLRRLVGDPALRASLGAAARVAYNERFEAQRVARRMQSFMAEVATLHGGREPSSETVSQRLGRLQSDVLALDPESASEAATGLLDPLVNSGLRQVRAIAQSSAPPPAVLTGPPRLTAVVVTCDRPELLSRALDSLERSEVPLEIVVIDNGSAPAISRRLADDCARRPSVKLRRSEDNLGCAGGRRLGVQLASTELVLFLDDDAELMPGALRHLLAQLDGHPSVGAVAATVVDAEGLVLHSGGVIERTQELATITPLGAGQRLESGELPESGPTDWVPGAAGLIRRALLDEFEIDSQMATYFEDAEWCYRIALARPGAFRRSREAVAVHHFEPRPFGAPSLASRSTAVSMITACARFYQCHGVLLAPALFEIAPELRGQDGAPDLAAARLLMELVLAKGGDWTLAAWMKGDLAPLLGRQEELALRWDELLRLRQAVEAQEVTLSLLHRRHETLARIEEGGWWRLRGRLLPVLRIAARLRAYRS